MFLLLHIALNICNQGVKAEQTESHDEVALRHWKEFLLELKISQGAVHPRYVGS